MISTFFYENKKFYKAIILKEGDFKEILATIPNFKEYRQRKSDEVMYLFGISEEEYKQGRQTQREGIEARLHKNGLDEDLVLSDILSDSDIDNLLSIRDSK